MSRDTDAAFMSELAAAAHLRPRLSASLLLFAILLFFVIAVTWASFAEIEEVTRGRGKVVPSRELQVVQSLEGGIVAEVLVEEGKRVSEGDLLLRIDDVMFAAEERSVRAELWGLRAAEARLVAQANGVPLNFPADLAQAATAAIESERDLYQSRRAEMRSEKEILRKDAARVEAEIAETRARLKQLRRSLELTERELAITQRMVSRGAVSETKLLALQQSQNEAEGGIAALSEKLTGLRADLAATRARLEKVETTFRAEAQAKLTETRTRIASLQETLVSREDRVRRTELRAPVDGVVQRILVNTIGGVVRPASPLVEIVPAEDDLIVRARVRPSDIAFLHSGQPVRVKVTAYDSQIYGSLKGTLERISADAVTTSEDRLFYEIDVRIEKTRLGTAENPLPIIPGMVAEVDVITGSRTVMSYLLSPILRASDRALREA